jgi:hypothetical protein
LNIESIFFFRTQYIKIATGKVYMGFMVNNGHVFLAGMKHAFAIRVLLTDAVGAVAAATAVSCAYL